jgi:HK97 gp10 family phage protein
MPVRFHATITRNRIAEAKASAHAAVDRAKEEQGRDLRDDTVARAPKGATQHLGESYKMEKDGETVWVYSDPAVAPYGKFVENGTSKMAAEPHFGPATHAAKRRYPRRISDAIKSSTASFG